jgi:UDP-3-O-acyl-N-acetylglucosamine deacetylase
MPIIGHIVAHKSGHGLNAQMVSKLLNSPQNWILVGSPENAGVNQQKPLIQQAAL